MNKTLYKLTSDTQKSIGALSELAYETGVQDGLIKANALNALKPLDKAEERWIPCSERLPKKPGSYICTCSDGTPYPKVTVIKFHPRTKAWELNGTRAYWKVRAWMPLPEPWKGEGND